MLTPLKRASYPTQCVWLDAETFPRPGDDGEERHHLWFGWVCYRRQLAPDEWSRPKWHRFTTAKDCWDWIERRVRPRTALWWYAHNAAYDATVVEAWTELPRRGWEIARAVLDSPPFLVYWRRGTSTLRMFDTLNLWQVSLKRVGEKVGLEKLPMPDRSESQAMWDRYCKRDVEVIVEACIEWWRWLREHDLGGAAPTMASQAFTAFRHRFLRHTIVIDNHHSALQLARDAYHGGRTEAFRVGCFDGPFYLLDVRSEYPTVMEREQYPTVFKSVYGGVPLDELRQILDRYAVVADVEVTTQEPAYPFRDSSPLLFPVGQFRAVLTSGELRYALEHGHVTHCRQLALYERAPIFRDYVQELIGLRMEAIDSGDLFGAWVLKRMLNALYGKFGQRGRRSAVVGAAPDLSARVWDEIDGETGERFRFRQLAGVIEKLWVEGESAYSHPAIAAHVTGHGRMLLWGLIQRAGRKGVLYCDTDSVLVSQGSFDALRPLLNGDGLGSLHLELVVKRAEIWGPKDYRLDEYQRTKGVRGNATWLDANTVEQEQWLGLRSLLRRGDLSTPIVRRQIKHLRRVYQKGIVLASGKVRPFRLPAENGRWLT